MRYNHDTQDVCARCISFDTDTHFYIAKTHPDALAAGCVLMCCSLKDGLFPCNVVCF